jgi:hypothetical protein
MNINALSRVGKHLLVRANLANVGRWRTATIGQGTEIGAKIITLKLSYGEVTGSIPASNFSKKAELKWETWRKTWKRFVQVILGTKCALVVHTGTTTLCSNALRGILAKPGRETSPKVVIII